DQPHTPGRYRRLDRFHLTRAHPPVQGNPRARRHLQRGRDIVLPLDRQVSLSRIRPAPARLLPDDSPTSPPAPTSVSPRCPRRRRANSLEGPPKTTQGSLEIRWRHGKRPPRVQQPVDLRTIARILESSGPRKAGPGNSYRWKSRITLGRVRARSFGGV